MKEITVTHVYLKEGLHYEECTLSLERNGFSYGIIQRGQYERLESYCFKGKLKRLEDLNFVHKVEQHQEKT